MVKLFVKFTLKTTTHQRNKIPLHTLMERCLLKVKSIIGYRLWWYRPHLGWNSAIKGCFTSYKLSAKTSTWTMNHLLQDIWLAEVLPSAVRVVHRSLKMQNKWVSCCKKTQSKLYRNIGSRKYYTLPHIRIPLEVTYSTIHVIN